MLQPLHDESKMESSFLFASLELSVKPDYFVLPEKLVPALEDALEDYEEDDWIWAPLMRYAFLVERWFRQVYHYGYIEYIAHKGILVHFHLDKSTLYRLHIHDWWLNDQRIIPMELAVLDLSRTENMNLALQHAFKRPDWQSFLNWMEENR